MRILTNVFSSDNFSNTSYDIAIADLDEENAKALAIYYNIYQFVNKSCPALDSMAFANNICRFYDAQDLMDHTKEDPTFPISEQEMRHLQENGWTTLSDDFSEPVDKKMDNREAYISVQLTEDGFWWRAEMLESTITLTTTLVSREALQRVL